MSRASEVTADAVDKVLAYARDVAGSEPPPVVTVRVAMDLRTGKWSARATATVRLTTRVEEND